MKKKTSGILSGIISAISNLSEESADDEYSQAIDMLSVKVNQYSVEEFDSTVMYPFNNCIDLAVKRRFKEAKDLDSIQFIYANYFFIKNSITQIIKKIEGSNCSEDKSTWLMNKLINYFDKEEKIDFTVDKKCFWKPYFWNESGGDEWVELVKALNYMYYGHHELYFSFVKDRWLSLYQEKIK